MSAVDYMHFQPTLKRLAYFLFDKNVISVRYQELHPGIYIEVKDMGEGLIDFIPFKNEASFMMCMNTIPAILGPDIELSVSETHYDIFVNGNSVADIPVNVHEDYKIVIFTVLEKLFEVRDEVYKDE